MALCRWCGLESHAPGANFCARCGVSLRVTEPGAVEVTQESPAHRGGATDPPAYQSPNEKHAHSQSLVPTQPDSTLYRPPPLPQAQSVNPNRLFDDAGRRTAHFLALARAIFVAIDQAERPRNTALWEQNKMELFWKENEMSSREHVDLFLDILYDELRCPTELINNKLTLTPAGFARYLEYVIKTECTSTNNLRRLAGTMAVYSVEGPALRKADFPEEEDPFMKMKQATIEEIYARELKMINYGPAEIALKQFFGYRTPRKYLRA